jgi:hypothetical protein
LLIRDMFHKRIDRDIKGVIKIGQEDDSNVTQELEEYVVTRELNRHFSDFFEAYKKGINGYTDKMGVWISGFFGSGKSHFLKILSYLLENRVVDSKKAVDYFNDKIKDPLLLADMKRTGDISADVILFNIDSKSEADAKANKDAIVKVFNRVFNDMQGFCGSIPWVADIERQMSADGTYEAFKDEFARISGRPWIEARDDFYYEEDAIVAALAAATRMSEEAARNWYNKAEENYSLTVDKFAKRVREYIESKGQNHHVVFCVDEMGQYIGDSSGLMLNLQTVVEDLGTECGGKAWVIVTSQQDIDAVTRVKGNDFSKIQGRFNTRLSLSSANVDEVVKRRILEKNSVATDTLKLLYENKSSILKNLITFSADTPEKKFYADSADFAEVYPFIPYQFNLLQQVLTSIRIHGSTGKHLAEGERSMISSFQESAIRFADREHGALIPFSAFYDTIEAFLDSNIRTVIIHAQDSSVLSDFDVELLKVLFMIKYVKEIPANIENLATLLVRDIDQDKIDLKKKIEESLKRLIKETLVQKNGDQYIFLTHEEQDINKEIKSIHVDTADIIQKASEIIFEEIYQDKKFKYSAHYNFPFNQAVDDRVYRSLPANVIGVRVITPFYDPGSEMNQLVLKEMSQKENNLIVNLPSDPSFLNEIEEILKIQTYLRKTSGMTVSETMEEIKARKGREVGERMNRVKDLLYNALQTSELFVNSQKLEIKEKDPVARLNEGFRLLINANYTKLGYINTFIESDGAIADILYSDRVQLNIIEEPNKLALDEVSSFIERNTLRHIPVTMKTVTSIFQKAPYGWNEEDIEGLIAKLFRAQEVKLQLNGEYLSLEDRDLVRYLTRREYAEKLLVEKRIKVSPALLNTAREICKEVFNKTALPSDEDGLMRLTKKYMGDEAGQIKALLENYKYAAYPGRGILDEGGRLFAELAKIKDTGEFFAALQERKERLLDYGEDSHDVKRFFDPSGKQKEIFDRALRVVKIFQKNKTYVLDRSAIETYEQIELIVNSKEPYSDIPKLPELVDKFNDIFGQLLEQECQPVRQVVDSDYGKIREEMAAYGVADKFGNKFKQGYDDLLNRLDRANNFYEAIAMKEESDRLKLRYMEEIVREAEKRKADKKKEKGSGEVVPSPKKKKTVTISMARLLRGARNIESQADLDKLLADIRVRLEEKLTDDIILKIV